MAADATSLTLPGVTLGQELAPGCWRADAGNGALVAKWVPGRADGARLMLGHVQEAFQDGPSGVAGLVDVEIREDGVWLLRPFIGGSTLADLLEAGPLPVKEALRVARQVAAVLAEAHGRGVLHGNLKPRNIFVQGTRSVTVSDFAVASLRDPLAGRSIEAGQFMSPEQSGLLDHDVAEWSDLYALGIILYHALVGVPPFQGQSLGEVLRQHLNHTPAPLRSLGVEASTDVEEIVHRLLRKDPRERYQSAEGLLADLDAVVAAMEAGEEPRIVVGAADRRRTLTEPAFLGRRDELSTLERQLAVAVQGRPALVWVEAESGGGKSRLLQEFAHRAQLRDAWVIRGQGRDQVAPRPFGMLEGIATAMSHLRTLDPEHLASIQDDLMDDAQVLTRALPGLSAVLGPTTEQEGPDGEPAEHGQERTLAALSRLLHALGNGRPAVLLLDDLQWADTPTKRLLERWWREADGTRGQIVVVAAFRAEEVAKKDPIRQMQPGAHLVLEPFDLDDMRHLTESMAGPLPKEAVAFIARLTEGNPFMASATLRGLVEAGTLQSTAEGWVMDPDGAVSATTDMAEFLLARLETLPEDAQGLLSVAAVLGKEFHAERAASLAGLRAHDAVRSLNAARRRHIIAHVEGDDTYLFTHDKLREAILDGMPAAERRALHHRAAEQLRTRDEDVVFELAYHYDAAADLEHAWPYALRAADRSRRRYALDTAERYYRIAEAAGPAVGEGPRFRILHGLGETLMLRGDYVAAEPWFKQAREVARGDIQRADLEGRLAELYFKRGDLEQAAAGIEQGLRMLGQPGPRTRFGHFIRLPKEVFVQTLHSLFPAAFVARRSHDGKAQRDLLAARLYSNLAHVNWFLRGPACCGYAHLREMNIAERYGPTEHLGMAYAEHAVVMTTLPWHGRGIDYGARALSVRDGLGTAWGRAHALHFGALGHLAAGHVEEALAMVEQAGHIFERTGDLWQANNSGWNQALLEYRLGRLDDAQRTSRRFFQAADRIGDLQNTGLALWTWALAGGQGLTQDVVEAEKARCPASDAQTGEAVRQAAGIMLWRQGRFGEAVEAFDEAAAIARSAGLRSEYVAVIPLWTATVLRARVEALPAWRGREVRPAMRRLGRLTRRGLKVAARYPSNLPHAWRERGMYHFLKGRKDPARTCIERAAAEAERLGMPHEADLCQAAHDALDGLAAQAMGPTARTTLSLADRFNAIVDVGRSLSTSIELPELVANLERASEQVLRGEQVRVFKSGEDPEDAAEAALVALAKGGTEPLVVPPEHPRLRGLGLRSALVFPVLQRGEHRLVVTATHRQVDGLYGPEEVDLARFLAAIAGAALENTEGFRSLAEAKDRIEFQASVLRSQAEAMIEGLLVVDDQGRIVISNRAFAKMWDIPSHIMAKGNDEAALAHALKSIPDPVGYRQRVQHLYDHPSEVGEDEIELKDGRILERYTAPVRGADGTLYGRAWFFRDVTERKRYEETLRASYDRLREVDKMRTAFINTAAHELNTPLTPIRMQLSILERRAASDLDERGRRSLDTLTRNIKRLEGLVKDIMDTARLESHRLRFERRAIDLDERLRDDVQSFKDTAKRSGIQLSYVGRHALEIHADPARLTQVVFNLMNNALRFTPDGGRIKVTLHADDDEATVRITDTGPGMTTEELDALFVPFSQPVPNPVGKTPGTGLGLVICKGIIEEHGGHMWVESPGRGRGATFAFTLPRSAPDTGDD